MSKKPHAQPAVLSPVDYVRELLKRHDPLANGYTPEGFVQLTEESHKLCTIIHNRLPAGHPGAQVWTERTPGGADKGHAASGASGRVGMQGTRGK
jgi:hypothetical protein